MATSVIADDGPSFRRPTNRKAESSPNAPTERSEIEDVRDEPAPEASITAEGFHAADSAWMLISSALVLMMTAPGLALVLRRVGPQEKYSGRDDAVHLPDGVDVGRVGLVGL